MNNIFDDLKKFAVSDILSVSGKDKTTKVIEGHMNVLVEVALIKGEQSKQAEVDELQNRIDELKMSNHNLSVMTAEAESYSDYWKYELDKLQKRVNELELINFDSELHFDAAKEHIDSLQKRIEDALKELEYIHFYKTQNSDNAIKILKGEQTK